MIKKKIYLAGSCSSEDRTRIVRIAEYLRGFCEVYCPFELKIPNAWNMSQEDWAREVFEIDCAAIKDCDMVIVISVGRESTAGTNWEQGYAYGIGKPVYVIQVTDKPTSLMTYWGCNSFINLGENNIEQYLSDIFEWGEKLSRVPCDTILT